MSHGKGLRRRLLSAALPRPQVGLLSASLVSHLFWPDAPEAELQLPEPIEAAMAEFGRRYQQLKSPRKLGWHPSLGVVELDVEVDGVAVEFKVGRRGGRCGGSGAAA
jgi:hypothetical protein